MTPRRRGWSRCCAVFDLVLCLSLSVCIVPGLLDCGSVRDSEDPCCVEIENGLGSLPRTTRIFAA